MLSDAQKEQLNALLAKQFMRMEPGTTCSRYSLMWELSRSADREAWFESIGDLRSEEYLAELDRYPGRIEAEKAGFITEEVSPSWLLLNGLYRRFRRLSPGEAPSQPPASVYLSTGGLGWESSIDVELLWGYGHARYDFNLGYATRGLSARRALASNEATPLLAALDDSGALAWDTHYKNPGVLDGEHWELLVRYADGTAFKSEGSNNWPEGFDTLYGALRDLGMMRYGRRGCMIESL